MAAKVQRQVHEILKGYGIAEGTSAQIAAELTAKERTRREVEQLAVQHSAVQSRRKIFGCIPVPPPRLSRHTNAMSKAMRSLRTRISNRPV